MTCMLMSNFKFKQKHLDKDINLEAEIILGEPSQLYFCWLTDYLSFFTFIDLVVLLYKLTSYEGNIYVLVFTV